MDINWSLLQPVDIGQSFQQGYQGSVRNALAVDEARHRLEERQRTETLRNALTGAYNPQTGQLDPQRARAAYLLAGDVGGAMELDARRSQHQAQVTEQQREQIRMGARIIQSVRPTDDAGWQQVLAIAQQVGIDLADVPRTYDEAYVSQVVAAGRALETQGSQNPPNIQREVEYYRGIGRHDLAQQLLERHAEGPPLVVDNGDGTRTIIPPSAIPRGGGRASPAPSAAPPADGGQSEAELRAQAAEAIRQGADPAQVQQRLEQMLRGGAGPSGPRNFR